MQDADSFHTALSTSSEAHSGNALANAPSGEGSANAVRHAAFAKVGAELFLERHSDDTALVRLHIGNLTFGIGQPRNGTEAMSVLRTFRDALTGLLVAAMEVGQQAAYAEGRKDEAEERAAAALQQARERIAMLSMNADRGDTVFRCGNNGAVQAALGIIDAALAGLPAAAVPIQQPTDERPAFEVWASDQGFSLRRLDVGDGDSYVDLRTQGVWDAWQARAALSSPAPAAAASVQPVADDDYRAWLRTSMPGDTYRRLAMTPRELKISRDAWDAARAGVEPMRAALLVARPWLEAVAKAVSKPGDQNAKEAAARDLAVIDAALFASPIGVEAAASEGVTP